MKSLLAEHLGSGREAKSWPKPTLPEFAFIGRSNVGKELVDQHALQHQQAGAGEQYAGPHATWNTSRWKAH